MARLAEEPLSISWLGMGLCVLWMGAVSVGTSRSLGLGLGAQLAIAAVRCVVQLSFLGYLLVPIFRANNWALTLGYLAVMVVAAAAEAAGRPSHSYRGMYGHVLVGLAGGALASAFYGLTLVLHAGLSAQYAIPITGMMLGNATSGVAVALSTILSGLSDGRDAIEARLALGGTRWEATRELLAASLRTGLTPVLNQMSIIGLVSIPGMMTGQILGGTEPSLAARYQAVIMFLVCASTSAGAGAACVLAISSATDNAHRLHSDRLSKRAKGGGDPLAGLIGRMRARGGEAYAAASRAAAGAQQWARRREGHTILVDEEDECSGRTTEVLLLPQQPTAA